VGDQLELPAILRLGGGAAATLALAGPADGPDLLAFYREIPEEDRLALKEDVTQEAWLERFLAKLRTGEAISVVARVGGAIQGEATLHRLLFGWARHVGEIRINVGLPMRRQGLGFILARHIVKIAIGAGLEKMVAHMVEKQQAARRTFERLGFHKEAELIGHVRDIHGHKRDLLIYADDVSHIWASMESLVNDFAPGRSPR
jgi:L-amino acid N-acyltransferase YncA